MGIFPARFRLALPAALLLAGAAWALGGAPAAAQPRSLQQIRPPGGDAIPAGVFVDLCNAADLQKSEYCDGYLRGVVLFWQLHFACGLHTHAEQSFCAGARDAEARKRQVLETLAAGAAPPRAPTPEDLARQEQRNAAALAKAPGLLRETLGHCMPGKQHDAAYCQGYNAWAQSAIAEPIALDPRNGTADAYTLGLGDATDMFGAYLMISHDAHRLRPCLTPAATTAEARKALLAFVRAHPEQQRGAVAIELISKALYYDMCPATPGVGPNMEPCLEWTSRGGAFGAHNTCGAAVAVRFRAGDAPVVEAAVKPGGFFATGLSAAQARQAGWLYTACPAGSSPSLWFNAADPETEARIREEIRAGAYDCEVDEPSR